MRSILGRTSPTLVVFSLSTLLCAGLAVAGGPPDSWTSAATMNFARQNHAVAMAAGNVVVIGGWGCVTSALNPCGTTGATYLNSAEQYLAGPRDSWAPIASMNSSRAWHSATTLPNGKILVTGGIGGATPTVLASAELYDPKTNHWTTTGPMKSARAGHTATLVPNRMGVLPALQVLIVGGITDLSGTISTTAEIYDPSSDSFTLTTALSSPLPAGHDTPLSPRAHHTALPLSFGAVLAGGGDASGPLAAIETFDLFNGFGFVSAGTLNTARAFHTATLFGTDEAVFIGGQGSGGDLMSAETWNAGTVALLSGTMSVGRESHTATPLPSGKVLVAGGLSGGMPQLSSEVWDPIALGFTTSRGSMTDARAFHTAVYILSPINRVLVAGGQGGTASSPVTLSSAELYRPGH